MFDPYLDWLKIPVERRPPTHYELLGLPAFESDAARIHNAVMDRMALVRRYQLGEHSETVVRLLSELSTAYNCLSDAQSRVAYDEELRALPEKAPAPPVAKRVALHRRRLPSVLWLAGAVLVAVVAGVIVWSSMSPPIADTRPAIATTVNTTSAEKDDADPTSVAEPAEPSTSPRLRAGNDPQIRYFGYSTAGPPSAMAHIAAYTNIVFVRDWVDRDVIAAAKEAGLPIVLCIQGKERDFILKRLPRILEQHGEAVLAVCWFHPYMAGYKPADVSGFGHKLEKNHPQLQFWLGSLADGSGKFEAAPVPAEVDVIVVQEYNDPTPAAVTAKGNGVLPGWLEKAKGRPIVLCWASQMRGEKSLVPRMELGTFRACVEVARRHHLAGVIFDRYGDVKGQERPPIESRPELEREIRDLAQQLGFDQNWSGETRFRAITNPTP